MIARKDLTQVGKYVWEIPQSYRSDMRVPARIFADQELLTAALEDRSIEQVVNTASLPGIVGYSLAMPDIHQGYGFSIGGVAATGLPAGVVSPGGVGYDINCGVRMLGCTLTHEEARPYLADLINSLFHTVPSGVGEGGGVKLDMPGLDRVLRDGAAWAVSNGYGTRDDLERTEERGAMPGADPAQVSARAKTRGRGQMGSLGSGNHFLEIQVVEQVFDPQVAEAFGLFAGQLAVSIHCGSRGLGHQVCTDYVRSFQDAVKRYNISLPDRELVCAPMDSPEGKAYFGAMAASANFAWANRQCLAHLVRRVFERKLAGKTKRFELIQVYDVAHNIAKIEEHVVDGKKMKLCVHRKGATRAFPAGHPDVPAPYRSIGQPVLVPGDMGTASYVMVGAPEAMELSFGSAAHGAGRLLSRAAAKRQVRGESLKQRLEADGILVRAESMSGLAEEAPEAYKDIDRVVEVVQGAGLARKVARLRPLAVMKG